MLEERDKVRLLQNSYIIYQEHIFWPSSPLGGGKFLSKLKNREEFEETSNKSQTGKNFDRGGEQFLWLARTYAPEVPT